MNIIARKQEETIKLLERQNLILKVQLGIATKEEAMQAIDPRFPKESIAFEEPVQAVNSKTGRPMTRLE